MNSESNDPTVLTTEMISDILSIKQEKIINVLHDHRLIKTSKDLHKIHHTHFRLVFDLHGLATTITDVHFRFLHMYVLRVVIRRF